MLNTGFQSANASNSSGAWISVSDTNTSPGPRRARVAPISPALVGVTENSPVDNSSQARAKSSPDRARAAK